MATARGIWILLMVAVSVFLVTFCYVLPRLCEDMIYSIYFRSEDRAVDIVWTAYRKNVERLREASLYLKSVLSDEQASETELRYSPGSQTTVGRSTTPVGRRRRPSLAVGVTSVCRSPEKDNGLRLGYLTQVVAALHRQATADANFARIHIFICNVDKNGIRHEEATSLASLIPTHVKYRTEESLADLRQPWQIFEKEKRDYQFCLETSSLYNADYVVVLEDDAVPKDGFFNILYEIHTRNVLATSAETRQCLNTSINWAFIKLYHPEKWAGYAFDWRSVIELSGFGLLGGVLSEVVLILLRQLKASRGRQWSTDMAAFFVGGLYVVCVLLALGRPYVLEFVYERWRLYWVTGSKHCCTQAVLYPAVIVPHLIKYISRKECDIDYSIDLVLEDFVTDCKLDSYLVEPNIINHIGMFSSLRAYAKRPGEFI